MTFLLGVSQTSGNRQSKDVTAQLMAHTGGRWLVLAIGVGVVVAGIVIIVGAVRKTFAKQLRLTEMSPGTRHVVETFGKVGGTACGIVFGVVGVFLIVAAATFDANKAQGLDGALRKIAETPLGLVTFGVNCCCEARWRKVRPGWAGDAGALYMAAHRAGARQSRDETRRSARWPGSGTAPAKDRACARQPR